MGYSRRLTIISKTLKICWDKIWDVSPNDTKKYFTDVFLGSVGIMPGDMDSSMGAMWDGSLFHGAELDLASENSGEHTRHWDRISKLWLIYGTQMWLEILSENLT